MNINEVKVAGRLTRDPEIKNTPSGLCIASVDLALNSRIKKGDAWEDKVTYLNDVTFFGKAAESIGSMLTKGTKIYIDGRLEVDSWQDKQTGKNRSKLKVVGNSWQFVESRKSQGDVGNQQSRPQQAANSSPENIQFEEEDDIPF